ncbi:hypothetical protein ABZX30_10840 [Streptomyces sp. NPDC004542]|uniref:Rv1733c family protein n=1 Tax=Streptomyces sp. NPDC004542 TaxID=3154281 RepID=UPI0033A069F4
MTTRRYAEMREDNPANRRHRRTRVPLWRWRSNPVRRRDDVLEAWLLLVMWVLVAVGGTAAGVVTARAADQGFARQRADRTPVRAVLLDDVPRTPTSGTGGNLASARVRWTASDGSPRTGRTLVAGGKTGGSAVRVWIDGRGKLGTRPPSVTAAAVEAGCLGASAALAVTGLVLGAGSVGRKLLDCRRIQQWDREWTLVGPQWGHKTG